LLDGPIDENEQAGTGAKESRQSTPLAPDAQFEADDQASPDTQIGPFDCPPADPRCSTDPGGQGSGSALGPSGVSGS
jgi:hypothetical protein